MDRKPPSELNGYHSEHIVQLLDSYQHWTGQQLVQGNLGAMERARLLFNAPFAVLSHTAEDDPMFSYANLTAMNLFECDWSQITQMKSKSSAETPLQSDRKKLLTAVRKNGFSYSYTGVRISRTGRRFKISDAIVWNVLNKSGDFVGQAATFATWEFLDF